MTPTEIKQILFALDTAYRAVGGTRSDGRPIRELLSEARALLLPELQAQSTAARQRWRAELAQPDHDVAGWCYECNRDIYTASDHYIACPLAGCGPDHPEIAVTLVCPECGSADLSEPDSRGVYECVDCRSNFDAQSAHAASRV